MFNIGLGDVISVKDAVHGYIEIPRIFVEKIIDAELFQRLRHIEQTGMHPVYASGRHDRFIHSLGVYHLGIKAADCLLENFSNSKYWNINTNTNKNAVFWAKNKVLFLIACLLHDIGHAPFSHALESFYTESDGYQKTSQGSPHEQVSADLVKKKFIEPIKKIFEDLKKKRFPNPDKKSDIGFMPATNTIEYSDDDIEFIQRMITGNRYNENEGLIDKIIDNTIKNCFISMLNGKIFDVDKLDYIIRDTFMSGLDNTVIDYDRLLKSLTIIPAKVYKEADSIEEENVFIKEAQLVAKHTGDIERGSINFIKTENEIVRISVENVKKHSVDNRIGKIILGRNISEIAANSEFKYENNVFKIFVSSIDSDIKEKFKYELNSGKAMLKNTFFSGKIEGKVKNAIIMGAFDDAVLPLKNQYYSFALGYKKGALSVIQNLVYARNYLYLWVYAQHKIVYYSKFLLPKLYELSKVICSEKHKKPLYDCKDADIVMLLEQTNLVAEGDLKKPTYKHFNELYKEFQTREYKKSLYKTIDEYKLFYWMFSKEELNGIYEKLKGENQEYGSIEKEVNKCLVDNEENPALAEKIELEELVWVKTSYEKRMLDPDEILVEFNKVTVCTLSALANYKSSSDYFKDTEPFYLYYKFKTDEKNSEEKTDELIKIDKLKNAIIKYFKTLL